MVDIKGTFGIGDRVCCAGLADSHEARVEGVESLWPVERDKKNLLAFLPFHEDIFVRHRVRRHESPLCCRGSKRSARSGNGALAMERMRCAGFSGPQVLHSKGGSCHQDGAFLQFPLANHMGKIQELAREKVIFEPNGRLQGHGKARFWWISSPLWQAATWRGTHGFIHPVGECGDGAKGSRNALQGH